MERGTNSNPRQSPGDPSVPDPIKAVLHRYLKGARSALIWKLDGLSERDARWPQTPTGTNLLGLVKHVAGIEAGYFGLVFGRPFPEPLPTLAEGSDPNADMYAAPGETRASVLAFADRAWAHADATIEALPLEATGRVPWWETDGADVTLGQILVDVLADVSRHAGQADIVRETIDGSRGMREGGTNLPTEDEQWWVAYVARLKEIAAAADGAAPNPGVDPN